MVSKPSAIHAHTCLSLLFFCPKLGLDFKLYLKSPIVSRDLRRVIVVQYLFYRLHSFGTSQSLLIVICVARLHSQLLFSNWLKISHHVPQKFHQTFSELLLLALLKFAAGSILFSSTESDLTGCLSISVTLILTALTSSFTLFLSLT